MIVRGASRQRPRRWALFLLRWKVASLTYSLVRFICFLIFYAWLISPHHPRPDLLPIRQNHCRLRLPLQRRRRGQEEVLLIYQKNIQGLAVLSDETVGYIERGYLRHNENPRYRDVFMMSKLYRRFQMPKLQRRCRSLGYLKQTVLADDRSGKEVCVLLSYPRPPQRTYRPKKFED